jgi:hypothetical protein
MAAVSTANKNLLNRMNQIAKKVGLGTILENTAGKVIASGKFTTVGGDATESITATGAASTDAVFVSINTVGATPRTVTSAVGATNAITVTMSGDPSTDHVLNYMVVRAL